MRVRQAIAWTIDRQAMTDTILFGHGRPIDGGTIPDWSWAYSDLHVYTQPDIEKAKQLMEDAGYEDGFDLTIGAGRQLPRPGPGRRGHRTTNSSRSASTSRPTRKNGRPTSRRRSTRRTSTPPSSAGSAPSIRTTSLYPRFTPKGSFDQSGYNNPQVD